MPTSPAPTSPTIALIGNPNTGKSTLFSALAGIAQRVGNYPGVTVEKKVGQWQLDDQSCQLIDLPGTYSLAPRSPDEMVAVDVLLGQQEDTARPDAVICIVDASNLQRNLYLVSQVLEMGLPTVVALNMIDVAEQKQIQIDVEQLQQRLQVPVVTIQANRKTGIETLADTVGQALQNPPAVPEELFPESFQQERALLLKMLQEHSETTVPGYMVTRLLLDSTNYLGEAGIVEMTSETSAALVQARARLAEAGHPVPGVEAVARYGWVGRVLEGVVQYPDQRQQTFSDRLDRFLTHRLAGSVVFVVLMLLVFQAIFSWAIPLMDYFDAGVGWVAGQADGWMADGALKSLLIDGVIAGVGGVLIFLPQIFILFFFVAILEDCGYMSRAAYLMDRLMSRVGLSGKSFIPLLSSFACAIPGIMATRVIENRQDRFATILVAPLMSCSARLPVYVLLTAAMIPSRAFLGGWISLAGLVMFSMYMLGIIVAVLVALVLKKTLLKGETPPFVMELPGYKVPSCRLVLGRMLDRGWAFVRRAGTLIFAVTIVIWAAGYFPHNVETENRVRNQYAKQLQVLEKEPVAQDGENQDATAQLAIFKNEIDKEVAGAYLHESILGHMGTAVEPLVRPLGWDWRIGCAAIASFPAREVVVGTLGVIYNLGDETDAESTQLRDKIRQARWDDQPEKPVYTIPVALSLMVFFALCAQCGATLVTIGRETNSWRWPLFAFTYMTGLAYLGALLTYQLGTLFFS
jgi:ferrous iron transport protein B